MRRLVCLVALLPALACAQQVKWDFADGKLTWQPRTPGVKLELTADMKTPGGKPSLHVAGSEASNWNYAVSDTHPMAVGQAYRLSLWMCAKSLGEGTQAPSVKCEFVGDEPGNIGRVTTEAYDTARLGQWQRLSVEFRAPQQTARFWLAVEKGANTPMAVDLYLGEVLVEPIQELTIIRQYVLDPLPAPLQQRRGVHPRLYLDAAGVARLREAVKTTHAAQWQRLQALAERLVKSGPPQYIERDKYSGDEQLWQREVGNAMPTLALVWLVTQDKQYLDSARAWALASCSYPTWGLGRIDGMDLATGHQLFGLGLVYDWCYADLGDEARRTIRDTLQKRAGRMYEAAASGEAWWQKSYLQNHLWVNACGMAVAGLAVYDELPEATRWIGLPLDKFKRTMQTLGSDGASHEGVGYWQYGVEYMLKFMELARSLLECDLFDHPWWRNTASYALYLQLPRQAWTSRSNIVDLADCPRGNWYGPDYLLWKLAHEYHFEVAQWQANEEAAANITAGGAPWLNLLWYDPQIQAIAPSAGLPTLMHFTDLGIVSARTDWTGNEPLLVFKSGPFLGHEAVKKLSYDAGGGHVHPDANHFVLFGSGEWLIKDDGYADKRTGQHNTLLVDGQGQTGEGKWFSGASTLRQGDQPTIFRIRRWPGIDWIGGRAQAAYPQRLGLKRFRRHLIFFKPDALVVVDDIECDAPRALELRFHPEQQQAEQDGGAFICRGKTSTLRIQPLTTEGVQVAAEVVEGQDRNEKPLPMFTIGLRAQQQRWRNATALSWCAAGKAPQPITMQVDGDLWRFIAFGKSATFDWSKDEVIVP
ncbi:DUF4962 domain-containing protein [bacterium]|nr:DUF4962 domain-containing protein [bacterium]